MAEHTQHGNLTCKQTATGMQPFETLPECSDPGFEYEWPRVKRLRCEKHPLIKGGQWLETPRNPFTIMERAETVF